ncbi:hypothetical protein TRFO_07587 [Tritrichomonas foetus]|uniref:Beige/BEACH domain containing protein n=1 Tax=Tritrichomonas foetus TaxID=1144522 RepID=A0A1J4JQB3_9EUKA|nr:hypothetical protein TRFO_07587 [Tritrichomonas foetus]|eukprot:OHT01351.1 hypothetical protein TRFO_07587 [Tritrichomonas foetus]
MFFEENYQLDQNVTHIKSNRAILNEIINVYSLKMPEDSYLFTYDKSMLYAIFKTKKEEDYLMTASVLFDFQESLNNVKDNLTYAEVTRKLIAFGYFSPQIAFNIEFGPEICRLILFLKNYYFESSRKDHLLEGSFSLAFALSSISTQYSAVDFHGKEGEMLKNIFDIYLLPNLLNEVSIPLYLDFFIAVFLNIPIEKTFEGDDFEIFTHLMQMLISTVTMDLTYNFDYLDLTMKLLSFMASHNLPLTTRIELFKLLVSISSKYEDAAMMLVDKEYSLLIVRFICDYISDVPFDLQLLKSQSPINLISILPKVRTPATSFLEPFFDEPYQPLTDTERLIRANLNSPEEPEPISKLRPVLILMAMITDLCHSIRYQYFCLNHIVFLRLFLQEQTFNELPIGPFFAALWSTRLILNNEQISSIADYFHDINFYTKMLDICFLKYDNANLKQYMVSFLTHLACLCPKSTHFLSDLLKFFEKMIRTVRIGEDLAKCISVIASMNNSFFIEVCNQTNFVISIGTYLIMYQEIKSNTEPKYIINAQQSNNAEQQSNNVEQQSNNHEQQSNGVEQQSNNETKLDSELDRIRLNRKLFFNFIEEICYDNEVFSYFFTKEAFTIAIMSHFFDVTTVDFAISHINLAISSFNANYPCIRYIFKFFVTKLFKCMNTPYIVINKIIDFCIHGFIKNPFTIGQIFAETNFLEMLVNFSIEIEATESIEKLLELLKYISTTECNYSPNISIFLKLSPLIKSRKNMTLTDYLLKIVFDDDNKMEFTRKIVNPGPLSLLLQIYKDDKKVLSDFLIFIQQCFALSMFEIVQTNLPSQLIRLISEYRNNNTKDDLFDQILSFLSEIMSYSISPQDLLSFFQLLTIIPEKVRPFYTNDLINSLITVFKNQTKSALTFFSIDKYDHGVELPTIPADLLNNGFTLTMRIQILERSGNVFNFSNANEFLILSFDSETLLNLNGSPFEQTLPMVNWFTFSFTYNKSGYIQIICNDREIIRQNIKLSFKDDFNDNTIALQLKCNIESIKLEGNKLPFFSFDAYSFCNKYAVNQNLVAEVHGTVFHLPQPPKVVLTAIGGAAAIIPLFAQLELPCEKEEKIALLVSILTLIEEVLYDSPQLQSDFRSADGFRMIGELLSIVSIDTFTNQVIDKLFDVFNALVDKDLQKQMIEYIFFNMNIWIYVIDIHQYFFPKLFDLMINIAANDSFFVSILNIHGLLYLMKCYLYTHYDESISLSHEPKVTIDGKTLAERPTKLKKLRSLFLNFLVRLANIAFDENDLLTILYFCFDKSDITFQCGIIILLAELIRKRNKFLFKYLSLGVVQFCDFIDFLQSPNPKLCTAVITLFGATMVDDITKFTPNQIKHMIIRSVNPNNLDLNLCLQLNFANAPQSLKIPLTLYILTIMPEIEEVPKIFHRIVNNKDVIEDFNNSEHFFYIYIISCYYNTKFESVFPSLIDAVASLCLTRKNPFASLLKFTEMVEQRTKLDLSPFLRAFFERSLEIYINEPQLIPVFYTIYSYLFRIPENDSFSRLFIDRKQPKSLSFMDLFDIMNIEGITFINYSFGLRTTFDGEWLDANIAKKIISLVSPTVQISEEFALIIGTGIQHKAHEDQFFMFRGKMLSLFQRNKDDEELVYSLKHSFIIFFGSLCRAVLSGSENHGIIDNLQSEIHTFYNFACSTMRTKPIDDNIMAHFLPLFVEKLSKIEDAINRKLSENYKFDVSLHILPDTSIFINHQPMDLHSDQIYTSIKNFATFITKSKRQSMKKYKQLFQALSSDNGPWTTPENPPLIHYKMAMNSQRTRLIPNLKFNNHKDASLARDLGSFENAQAILKEQIAKLKLKSFAGDFSLIDFDDVDEEKGRKSTDQQQTDKIIAKCQSQLITPRKVHSGDLNLTKKAIFFESKSKYVRLPLHKIKKILFRRYLMGDTAIEIFCTFSRAYFVNFVDEGDRLKFLNKVAALKISNIKFIQRRNEDVKALALKATEKWQNGEISNFDYLMKLNTLAGRSFNDLSQYPVFPWILSDYKSKSIDFNNPEIYRDLSKPIGAISETRLSIMRERMDEGIGDETKYLYGSLYSSAAVVIGYLIRMEPFTSLHITLQSGRFDITDRLFVSIPSAWDSVTQTQMDFRELIPEFFLIPDFLVNVNDFDLGMNINKERIGDVKLPVWANTPRDFIEANKIALESSYVSANLHKWIDLIFGPHSRMPLANEVNNVFHPYFYESAMSAALHDHGVSVSLLKEYSACFGCCPLKIFDKFPEPRVFRKLPQQIKSEGPRIQEFSSPIINMSADDDYVIVTSQNLQFAMLKNSENIPTSKTGKLTVIIPDELRDVPSLIATSKKFAILAIPWSTSFSIFLLNAKNGNATNFKDISVNSQPISAIAASRHFFATASTDCTLRTWKFTNNKIKPIGFLAKHNRPVKFIEISEKLNAVYSLSSDGFISCMSLLDGRYLCGVDLGLSEPSLFAVSKSGYIIVAFNGPDSATLVVLDQNLEEITRPQFDSALQCWTPAEKGGKEHMIIILKAARMEIRELPYLSVRPEYSTKLTRLIQSIAFTKKPKPKLFIGNSLGNILALDIE